MTQPGGPTNFTKPVGATEVKPAVAESPPRTNFDEFIYEWKPGDTFDSVSQEYYNSKRYAAALREFNKNVPPQPGRTVDVPPIHVLKKLYPRLIPATATGSPAPTTSGSNASGTPEWGAPPKPEAARPSENGRGTFVVPAGGMTMQAIARQVGVPWDDIYFLNPMYTKPDAVLPAGTELQMPATARR